MSWNIRFTNVLSLANSIGVSKVTIEKIFQRCKWGHPVCALIQGIDFLVWRNCIFKDRGGIKYRFNSRWGVSWIVRDDRGLEKLYLIGAMRYACGDCYPIVQGRSKAWKFSIILLLLQGLWNISSTNGVQWC
jgi:hypothetical protein